MKFFLILTLFLAGCGDEKSGSAAVDIPPATEGSETAEKSSEGSQELKVQNDREASKQIASNSFMGEWDNGCKKFEADDPVQKKKRTYWMNSRISISEDNKIQDVMSFFAKPECSDELQFEITMDAELLESITPEVKFLVNKLSITSRSDSFTKEVNDALAQGIQLVKLMLSPEECSFCETASSFLKLETGQTKSATKAEAVLYSKLIRTSIEGLKNPELKKIAVELLDATDDAIEGVYKEFSYYYDEKKDQLFGSYKINEEDRGKDSLYQRVK